jgi:hypothetical protein
MLTTVDYFSVQNAGNMELKSDLRPTRRNANARLRHQQLRVGGMVTRAGRERAVAE